MTRRLLIVSPHFPPVNAPDMHRVRMSLPYFLEAGWEVMVLAADDSHPLAPLEPELNLTVPAGVRVVRVRTLNRRWTGWLGINNLGWRILSSLHAAGKRAIREWRPDLVYFSTTQFITLPLGRLWWRRFGVPYVIDLQDPWLNEFYDQPGSPPPPGGWKFSVARQLARRLEGWTLSRAAHVLSVSPAYLETLARRYPWWSPDRGSVLPFGASDRDLAVVQVRRVARAPILPKDGALHIAYAGRLGADMLPSLDLLFAAIARCADHRRPIRLSFFGSSYAGSRANPVTGELARRHGLLRQVQETPARIGYLDSLQLLLETDVALILGSADRSYSPSKIHPTLLAARPTLAIAPVDSVLARQLSALGGATVVTYDPKADDRTGAIAAIAGFLVRRLDQVASPAVPPLDRVRFEREFSARAVATAQLDLFRRVLRHRDPPAPAQSKVSA